MIFKHTRLKQYVVLYETSTDTFCCLSVYPFAQERVRSRWTNCNRVLTGIVLYNGKRWIDRLLLTRVKSAGNTSCVSRMKSIQIVYADTVIFYESIKFNVIFNETRTYLYTFDFLSVCLFVWERLWNELTYVYGVFIVIILPSKQNGYYDIWI